MVYLPGNVPPDVSPSEFYAAMRANLRYSLAHHKKAQALIRGLIPESDLPVLRYLIDTCDVFLIRSFDMFSGSGVLRSELGNRRVEALQYAVARGMLFPYTYIRGVEIPLRVAEIKHERGLPIYVPEREKEVMEKWAMLGREVDKEGNITTDGQEWRSLARVIMRSSRLVQKDLIQRMHKNPEKTKAELQRAWTRMLREEDALSRFIRDS